MGVIDIEALVRDIGNVRPGVRFFEVGEPQRSLKYIIHEQAAVEAAIAMGRG